MRFTNKQIALVFLVGIAFAIAFARGLFPFEPQEGDVALCWKPFVDDWLNHGLGTAITHTPSRGKFPGFPILIIFWMKLTQQPFMDALQFVRLFMFSLSFFGFYFLLNELGFVRLWAWVITGILHLHTAYTTTTIYNLQDSSKPGFFMFSVYFSLRLLREEFSKSLWLGLIVSSCFLGMTRIVDLFPFLVFLFFYNFRNRKFRATLKLGIPSVVFMFGLLVFGKSYNHHWGFSNGEAPQPWVSAYYLPAIKASHSIIDAIKFPIVNVVNKTANFTNDYFFMQGNLKMVGLYRFMKDFEIPNILSALLGVILLSLVIRNILRDLKCKSIWTVFLYSGFVAWGFWTFGLNHYEARYWSLVFICWAIGLLGPVFLRLQDKYDLDHQKVFVGLVAVFVIGISFNFHRLVFNEIPFNYQRLAIFSQWKELANEECIKKEPRTIIIPRDFLIYSSFPYIVQQACPRININCVWPDGKFCDGVDTKNTKNFLLLTKKDIDPNPFF